MKIAIITWLTAVMWISAPCMASLSDKDRRSLYTSSSSLSTWVDCIDDSNQKWCAYGFESTDGYWCSTSESSYFCGGSTDYTCSNNGKYDPKSRYILCPSDISAWGTQTSYFSYDEDNAYFSSGSMSSNQICKYQLESGTAYVNKYEITLDSMTNAEAYIYTVSSSGNTDYEKEIKSGETKTIKVGYYEDAYVIVMPTSNNAYVSFSATSKYSSSSSYSSTTSLSGGAIAGIVIGGFVFFWFLIGFIILAGVLKQRRIRNANAAFNSNRAARMANAQQNQNQAIIMSSSPAYQPQMYGQQPQLYYEPYPNGVYPSQPVMEPVMSSGSHYPQQQYDMNSYPTQNGVQNQSKYPQPQLI